MADPAEEITMKIKSKDFRVRPGVAVKLKQWPTRVKPVYQSKKHYKKLLEEHVDALSALQQLHYASHRYALLLIFQGMDAGGKDGANWRSWHFERLIKPLTALSGSHSFKPPALPEVADSYSPKPGEVLRL